MTSSELAERRGLYASPDPAFRIAYRSTVDDQIHLITVRAINLRDARDGFEMRCAPGATVLAVRGA